MINIVSCNIDRRSNPFVLYVLAVEVAEFFVSFWEGGCLLGMANTDLDIVDVIICGLRLDHF